MTALAQQILNSFDELSAPEQLEIAQEILRRLANLDFPPLTNEDLVFNTEELFLALDQQEAKDEWSKQRRGLARR